MGYNNSDMIERVDQMILTQSGERERESSLPSTSSTPFGPALHVTEAQINKEKTELFLTRSYWCTTRGRHYKNMKQ